MMAGREKAEGGLDISQAGLLEASVRSAACAAFRAWASSDVGLLRFDIR